MFLVARSRPEGVTTREGYVQAQKEAPCAHWLQYNLPGSVIIGLAGKMSDMKWIADPVIPHEKSPSLLEHWG